MRRNALLSVALTLSLFVFVFGCSPSQPLSTSSSQPPTTTTSSTTPPQTQSPTPSLSPPTGPVLNTWGWQSSANITLDAGQVVFFPDIGASVESGRTLTVTWDADGTLAVFLLTSDQYHKFSAGQAIPASAAYQQASQGSFTYYVQSPDSFYVLLRNLYPAAAIRVYQAELTER